MSEGYTHLTMVWQDRTVEISYQANWLNSGYWHIELRCDELLPVTSTGYRSYFVPIAGFENDDEILACVTSWLDTAAEDPKWQKHLEDSRQLTLF